MNPAGHSENTLYYGDNLPILREHIPDESVDLVYLDLFTSILFCLWFFLLRTSSLWVSR